MFQMAVPISQGTLKGGFLFITNIAKQFIGEVPSIFRDYLGYFFCSDILKSVLQLPII